MRNKKNIAITILMVVAIVVFTACGATDTKTVTGQDGTTYKVDMQAVKANTGFASSDKDGKLTPLPKNDPDAVSAAAVVTAWADLTGNRSWENISGDEEYHLFSEELKEVLISEDDDINQTRMGYQSHETATKADNIKASNVVIFLNDSAYAVVEYDSTLIHSIDLEAAAEVGFDGVDSTKHDRCEFELQKDENGDYKITSFNNISDWKVQ